VPSTWSLSFRPHNRQWPTLQGGPWTSFYVNVRHSYFSPSILSGDTGARAFHFFLAFDACVWILNGAIRGAQGSVRFFWMLRTNTPYPEVVRIESSSRVPLAG